MGFFSGLKAKWKDGSLLNGLQAAGAIANGDYATAAQIKAMYAKQRDEEAERRAAQAQHQALVEAAIANGVPPEQARSLPPQTLAQIVSKYHGPESVSPMVRDTQAWQNMTPEQKAAYGQMMTERAGPASINLPNGGFYHGRPADLPRVLGQGGQGGRTVTRRGTDSNGRRVIQYSDGSIEYEGGAASNGSSNFRDAFADFLR